MQAAIQDLNTKRRKRGAETLGIGIGIDCGETVHGFIGNAERIDFVVIGDVPNRASRYCNGAAAGEILVSPALYEYVYKIAQAVETTISTKHEGDMSAFRVDALRQ
jgi:adenylate cyclase